MNLTMDPLHAQPLGHDPRRRLEDPLQRMRDGPRVGARESQAIAERALRALRMKTDQVIAYRRNR